MISRKEHGRNSSIEVADRERSNLDGICLYNFRSANRLSGNRGLLSDRNKSKCRRGCGPRRRSRGNQSPWTCLAPETGRNGIIRICWLLWVPFNCCTLTITPQFNSSHLSQRVASRKRNHRTIWYTKCVHRDQRERCGECVYWRGVGSHQHALSLCPAFPVAFYRQLKANSMPRALRHRRYTQQDWRRRTNEQTRRNILRSGFEIDRAPSLPLRNV